MSAPIGTCRLSMFACIAATHRRLINHIADKTFREDLYYRLNVIHIEVPPLRERREDVCRAAESLPADVLGDASRAVAGPSAPRRWPILLNTDGRAMCVSCRNVAERLVLRSPGRVEVATLPLEIVREHDQRLSGAETNVRSAVTPTLPGALRSSSFRGRVVLVRGLRAVHGARSDTARDS